MIAGIARLLRRLPFGPRGRRAIDEAVLDWQEERRTGASMSRRAAADARGIGSLALVLLMLALSGSSATSGERRPRTAGLIDRARLDLRHAWRSLSVRRGSALATVLVFALGLGLVTAMFALTDPYVLRPLPYENPNELVTLQLVRGGRGGGRGGVTANMPIPTVPELRARADLFKSVAAIGRDRRLRLALDTGSVAFTVREVTPDLFDVLGTPAPRSGAWRPEVSAAAVSVLLTPSGSAKLPARTPLTGTRLTAHEPGPPFDPRPVENAVQVDIAGALSDGFLFPVRAGGQVVHALAPFEAGPLLTVTGTPDGRASTMSNPLMVIARVQPGVTPDAISGALARPLPSGQVLAIEAAWLTDHLTADLRALAWGALGAGVIILLVCAGNVANLTIARGSYRTREFATRHALGASRADIARLWLVELGATAVAAILAALPIAWIALQVIARVIPDQYVTLGLPALTIRVSSFTVLAGLAVAALALVPAAFLTTSLPGAAAAPAGAGGRGVKSLRVLFAGAQAAFAMVLAVGAAMLVQSYANLMRQDIGYDGTALIADVAYPKTLGAPALDGAVQASIEALRRVPGVGAVAASSGRLPAGEGMFMVTVGGERAFTSGTQVSPGFFDAAGMTLVEGRALAAGDEGWSAIVVNQAFVRAHWPDASPLGQVVNYQATTRQAHVVGVARNAIGQLPTEPRPMVYELMTPDSEGRRLGDVVISYVIRSDGDPRRHHEAIRRTVASVSRDAVIGTIDTIDGRLANTVRDRTFATLVLTFFGVAGGAVTVAGLIGIVTFVVARRTREIAIRMAIGADRGHVRRLVVREAMMAAVAGGVAGLLAGRWLSGWLESLVYGIEAGNWTTTLAAGAVMLALMVIAALVPARRAVNLQPTEALRVE